MTCTITVGANEAPPGEGAVFSPPSSLILSAESPPAGGRSYLVGLRGMDTDGNPDTIMAPMMEAGVNYL